MDNEEVSEEKFEQSKHLFFYVIIDNDDIYGLL